MSCVILNDKIREFASNFKDETPESVANVLGLWWEANPDRIEKLPSVSELRKYMDNIRSSDAAAQMLDNAIMSSIADRDSVSISEPQIVPTLEEQQGFDLVFDPITRRDRATLISRLFSNEITKALKKTQDTINKRLGDKDLTDTQRRDLTNELNSLDRLQIINSLTPRKIFDRVRKKFEKYINNEEKVQDELEKINSTKGAEKYSKERKLEAAKKRADYKTQEYQKIVSYFDLLAQEASRFLPKTEGIRIILGSASTVDVNHNSIDPEGYSEGDNQSDNLSKEESYKDGWMNNYRHVSSYDSLSQAVRKVINEIPRLDYRGKYEKDDLGNNRYLDADYVHATLIDKLKDMVTSEDMIPLLKDLSKLKPWVKQIIKVISNDDSLFSQFYQDFRKDFIEYWIQKSVENPDGSFIVQTIPVNKPEGTYYLIDSWRDNHESRIILDEDSVYKNNGEINKEHASKGLSIVEELNNQFQRLNTQERLDLLDKKEVWNKLIKVLNMIGIDPNPSTLRAALTNIKSTEDVEITDPIILLISQLNVILSGLVKGKVKSEILEDGTVKRGDIINTFGTAYDTIAGMLAEVTEDAIESSVREGDKTYYAHLNPSYIGKIIKLLKNVSGNKKKFAKFMQTEYKQYEWFFKNGEWRNDWLHELDSDPSMRKILKHKVLLSYNKKDYVDWDSIDYTVALFNEYRSDPNGKTAWYHVPIMSDSPTAEFIKFVRYTTGSEFDGDGNAKSYQDIITDKFIDLINQEYDRIQLVKERQTKYLNKEKIDIIANFDSNGDKFQFIPALNTYKYENGETFLERFERLRNESPSEFRAFLRDTIKDIMEQGFESDYSDWVDMGLFKELPNGKLRYISTFSESGFQGQSDINRKVANSLEKAEKILGDNFSPDMKVLLAKYSNNKAINDIKANAIFDRIRELLNEKVLNNQLPVSEASSIIKDLTTKNNSKEAFREYYWNSKFATSQIIQILTTDLAFYKNLEDFQKRAKEWHAPSLRLNTMAKFKGESIGRTHERTIYIADEKITSSTISDIKEILDAKISKGELTAIDRDYILSQYRKVNVADAQAYRSLSSYKAIMGMMGQWTDEMETAYNHLTDPDGHWTIQDFNVIWQTKKPFVYTQINKDSGVEGHTDIKVPVQHKNSEFLLLAMHNAIAGPLGKSEKLRAINKFMEDNQIDVVQFESSTKVGNQGIINLNEVNSYNDTFRVLKETTGIAYGIENPNVIHTVSYEDYGIQTQTPEHSLDSQRIGTQLRKLIEADIDDNATITVDGIPMSKDRWLKLYNAVNTENILQSFKEAYKTFQNPKELEKILLDEIRGSSRYSIDLARSYTLDPKTGDFNIPLFDPVQSIMVQQLLNSIIKNRITKQTIKGGALIQVTSYGLTDELQIVYEGTGTNKRIEYLECYMPAYSKELLEPLMDENGQLDINKLPLDLRKLIGYRIPTEDKYSILPLVIKGFIPRQNGNAIMLPAEITTITGSDFDKLSMLK